MANTTTHVIRGKLHWAKVLGEPRMNTYTEEREWSVDVTPNKDGLAEIGRLGLKDKLREPKENDSRTEDFISFRQREFRTDKSGEKVKNKPIRIVDIEGNEWPQSTLLGNGTVADVKFNLRDNGKGRPKGIYIQAIRVLDLVPYEVQEFAPISSDDEFFSERNDKPDTKGESPEADDLDDDVPF